MSTSDSHNSPHAYPQAPIIEVVPAGSPIFRTEMTTSDGKRKRVGFTSDTTPPSSDQPPSSGPDKGHNGETVLSPEEADNSFPSNLNSSPAHSRQPSLAEDIPEDIRRNDISDHELSREIHRAFGQPYVPKPRPAIRKTQHAPDIELEDMTETGLDGEDKQKHISGVQAHDRAQKLAARVGSYNASTTPSRANSFDFEDDDSPFQVRTTMARPVVDTSVTRGGEDSDEDVLYQKQREKQRRTSHAEAEAEAQHLVRTYTKRLPSNRYDVETPPPRSGQVTPVAEQDHAEYYIPKPKKYRGGILASLLKLQHQDAQDESFSPLTGGRRGHARILSADSASLAGTTPSHTPGNSPPTSGASTPTSKHGLLRHWPRKHDSDSPTGLAALVGSSSTLALPIKEFGEEVTERARRQKHHHPSLGKRSKSSDAIASAFKRISKPRLEDEIRITVHIAETIARQKYLVKLCRALMQYGAPTHRLEEYLKASSRVLEIEAQFLYIPGCMLISFDDPSTHTTEVKLVRTSQGVDLGKLRDTHQIYKEVVHDQIGVEEATQRLDDVMGRKQKFNRWFVVLVYGFASLSVGPFAFQARLIDLPMAFVLGCLLGILQIIVAPRSDLYSNIFEISAAVLTSFLARAIGSIHDSSGNPIFCFSALAQSSIALILPGYTVLCASLELQSRSIVAGSVRMVYAIIYSLFLGFGITIGTVIYGVMDTKATSATTCSNPMPDYWYFFFVPLFTLCLIIINQAKWKQAPIMLVIAFSGYIVNFFTSRRFRGNAQVSQTLGALTIGIEANLYARLGKTVDNWCIKLWEEKLRPFFLRQRHNLRSSASNTLWRLSSLENGSSASNADKPHIPRKEKVGYGMAAAAMLPAIFVQVPSGLAVSGSLVSGITSADQIISNSTGTTTVNSGTDSSSLNSASFNVSYSVIQIAIGITVGLFLSALLVYPLGKKRSGLFSF